ncbi:c-type cytochrome [Paraglaciecola aquimarina]|uniref:C-type cytochrome n=1 Tax=Paraglaciecola algarum TaxID=3050085 RepID=A0ABS9D5X5_9ALTE|nr:c-type cytochrome [Paraglaciecola sp. G1-23]MCF2948333.1 c-type cytochrome [Paraglaciecola sp. G1-23]
MKIFLISILMMLVCSLYTANSVAQRVYEKQQPPRKLSDEQTIRAASNYKKYCILCHGENRQGHVNDHAPSLRSKSLFESGVPHSILRPISYGRDGTAMGGYLDEVGGPMTLDEVWDLTYWLFWQSGAERKKLTESAVIGDIVRGEVVYQQNCASCHGKNGEGVNAPALGNQSALAHNKDEFIRYAIEHGRQDTPMVAFSGMLSEQDIDNVTAFIRSKASGWTLTKPVLREIPSPDEYVINPQNSSPNFMLTEDKFVSSKQLYAALKAKNKMVLLDTRVTSVWQRAHIEGAIPFPYYKDLEDKVTALPKDVQIVAYCSCPRAAAVHVIEKLAKLGYTKTAVLYEGIFGWMNMGYPVTRAENVAVESSDEAAH